MLRLASLALGVSFGGLLWTTSEPRGLIGPQQVRSGRWLAEADVTPGPGTAPRPAPPWQPGGRFKCYVDDDLSWPNTSSYFITTPRHGHYHRSKADQRHSCGNFHNFFLWLPSFPSWCLATVHRVQGNPRHVAPAQHVSRIIVHSSTRHRSTPSLSFRFFQMRRRIVNIKWSRRRIKKSIFQSDVILVSNDICFQYQWRRIQRDLMWNVQYFFIE